MQSVEVGVMGYPTNWLNTGKCCREIECFYSINYTATSDLSSQAPVAPPLPQPEKVIILYISLACLNWR